MSAWSTGFKRTPYPGTCGIDNRAAAHVPVAILTTLSPTPNGSGLRMSTTPDTSALIASAPSWLTVEMSGSAALHGDLPSQTGRNTNTALPPRPRGKVTWHRIRAPYSELAKRDLLSRVLGWSE